MNKPVFTEEMTPEEFRKMTVEMAHWPRAAQEEATRRMPRAFCFLAQPSSWKGSRRLKLPSYGPSIRTRTPWLKPVTGLGYSAAPEGAAPLTEGQGLPPAEDPRPKRQALRGSG